MSKTSSERSEKRKRLYNERLEWGVCVICGAPLKGTKTHACPACLERQRKYQRKKAAERRSLGLCVYCDTPAAHGNLCERHYNYYKTINRERCKRKNADE